MTPILFNKKLDRSSIEKYVSIPNNNLFANNIRI